MPVTYETKLISRKTFDTWVELVSGENMDVYNGSRGRVSGNLENGVRWQLNFTAIFLTGDGGYYLGRDYSWNAVRVPVYFGNAFNFYGKGARSFETYHLAASLLELLTGEYVR